MPLNRVFYILCVRNSAVNTAEKVSFIQANYIETMPLLSIVNF